MRKGHPLFVLLIAFFSVIFVPAVQAGPFPTYAWHTFYGSSNNDQGYCIATDEGGNVYVGGHSYAAWDGPAGQSPLHAYSGSGGNDIFVMKLNSSGAYQWHTFYRASVVNGIATDWSGNVYVTGYSNASWNGPAEEGPLNAHSGSADIFVMKLDSSGAYQWHTFCGSSTLDYGQGIAADGSGNVYVTGYSNATWNGPAEENPLHAYSGGEEIFVLKLDSSGTYQWHTFYGASHPDFHNGIAADGSGNVYVTGYSNASWNGPAEEGPLNAYWGGADIFVLKLDSSGAYQWHTFYGASTLDYGKGIATDGIGNVFVTGKSPTTWNGPTGENPLNAHSGGFKDIFVLKLDTSGAYQWHTFYGAESASNIPRPGGIAPDGSGNLYVTGYSDATWNGPAGQSPFHAYSGAWDIFVLKLDSSGVYQWHTFYGASDYDCGYAIATDGTGNVYVTGNSSTTWNGPAEESPLHAHRGGIADIFILKFAAPDLIETAISDPPSNSTTENSFSVTDTVKNQGTTSAGASITSYYLSLDTVKSSGDTLLTGSRSVPSLGINETNDGILTVTIPFSIAPGSYYLLACADDTNAVEESDENNNCIASVSKVSVSSISVVSPNGGESLQSGTIQTIRWDYTGNSGAYLKIELLKGGVLNKVITSFARTSTRSFNWRIPATLTPGADYSIRITSRTNPVFTDTSNSNYTVLGPSLTLTSPNGGESWVPGTTQAIRWTYAGGPGVYLKIELLKGGILNRAITYLALTNKGSVSWRIPATQVPGTDYSIRITSRTNPSWTDTSDLDFTIGP